MTARKPAFDHIKLVSGTLKSILTTINGLEGLEREDLSDVTREVLLDFKNYVGTLKEFQTNEQLARLDKVFTAAGWDNQGLRWTKESDDDPGEEVFIVEFTDRKRRAFRPL